MVVRLINKKLSVFLVITFISIAGLIGCIEEVKDDGKQPVKKTNLGEIIYENLTLKDLNFTIDNYPNVDSSTSAYPLNYITACNILNASYNWNTSFFSYSRYLTITSNDRNISNYIERINVSGTHDAYINLIDENADLILVARLPSEDELSHAYNNSVELITKPVALDAFVFITNIANPVDSLTEQEIKDIYTKNIINWSQVGGNPNLIIAYQRNKNSGSQELMENLVMKDLEMANTPELSLYGMGGPFDQLIYDFSGVGLAYTVYYYKEFLTNTSDSIKMLGINGIIPSYENISNKNYKYVTEVYAVIRSDLETTSNAYKLRDYLLGNSGQELVKITGYVPIS